MSRKWDAREAGREVARSAIEKLSRPPSFFLLFSTIHYEKHGGFQELLNGVWDVLPAGTPLIGGTVTGFMNNFGCYAQGCTAFSVSSNKVEVSIGYGKNTKRNPKKAAKQSASMIKESQNKKSYHSNFLLNLVSASELPNIPPFNKKKIIKSGISTRLILKIFGFSQYVLQKGAGRDDEVLEEMTIQLPEHSMLSGGTIDEEATLRNYQFYNTKVLKNSIVSLGINTDLCFDVQTTHNMKKTGIDFTITKASKDGRIIHEINGKPALTEFLNLLGWPRDFLTEERWFKTNFYFPLGFHVSSQDDEFGPRVIGPILGETLTTTIRSKDPSASILTIDGRNLLNTIDKNLICFPNPPEFGLFSSCTTRLETMGDKIYEAHNRLVRYFGTKPFLVFYVGGESSYSPEKGLHYVNMSFNSAIFWKKRIPLLSNGKDV